MREKNGPKFYLCMKAWGQVIWRYSVKCIVKNFKRKHLFRNPFLIKFQPSTLLKNDSSTGVYQWFFWHFSEHLICGKPANDYFWSIENRWSFQNIHKQPPKVFYKKSVLKNFAIFTGKHLCWNACIFIKNRLQRGCFPVNVENY